MKAIVTVEIDLSPTGIERAIDELREVQARFVPDEESGAASDARRLSDSLGDGPARFFQAWATHFDVGSEHTLDEVAELMGETRATTRSYHRNAGRTLKRLDLQHALTSRWDGHRSQITMDPDLHEALAAHWSGGDSKTETMSRGRNFTVGERAIQLVGVMGGASREAINQQLRVEAERSGRTARELPQSSYRMLCEIYLSWVDNDRGNMWTHVLRPHAVRDLGQS